MAQKHIHMHEVVPPSFSSPVPPLLKHALVLTEGDMNDGGGKKEEGEKTIGMEEKGTISRSISKKKRGREGE